MKERLVNGSMPFGRWTLLMFSVLILESDLGTVFP